MNLLIIGAGGHGHVCKEIAECMRNTKGEILFEEISFLDDNSKEAIGKVEKLANYRQTYQAVFVAIGNPDIREKVSLEAKRLGYDLPNLLNTLAYVADTVQLGEGNVIMPSSVVQSNVIIGDGNIISSGAIIDHNAQISNYCHINAGAIVASMSVVPEKTKIDYKMVWK